MKTMKRLSLKTPAVFLLLAAALDGQPAARANPGHLLEHHLELAAEQKAYLQITPAGIWVFFNGVAVQFLPVRRAGGLAPETQMARVEGKLPVTPPPRIVVDADRIVARSAAVDTLEEIVSLEDMPPMFVLLLDDGSAILIRSEEPRGFGSFFRRKGLELKFAWRWLHSALRADSSEAAVLEMDARGARWFYWIVEEGMGVIY